MPTKRKSRIPWIVVIISLIFFWPIGLYLFYRKVSGSRSDTLGKGRILTVVSCILIFIGFIFFSLLIDYGANYLTPTLLFGGGGILMFLSARNMRRASRRYKQYIALVINQNKTNLDHIASALGHRYEVVKKDIEKMINMGYFSGAYINVKSGELVMPQKEVALTQAQASNAPAVVVKTCNSCLANNKVSHQTIECEYCGSPI